MNTSESRQAGAVNPLVISNVLLAILAIVFGAAMLWAWTNYKDQKDNVDAKVAVAVTAGKKEQADNDEKNFLEREKAPYEQFTGPDDLGAVSFNYPRTWSVYTAKSDATGLEAYLHPIVVPTVNESQQFALEVAVINRSSDSLLKSYEASVKAGKLKSSQIVVNGFSGTRLDGKLTEKITGSIVIFKVRDKTLTLTTDAETFRNDFDNVVLKSLDFNP